MQRSHDIAFNLIAETTLKSNNFFHTNLNQFKVSMCSSITTVWVVLRDWDQAIHLASFNYIK